MKSQLKILFLFLAALVLVSFVIFLINQVMSVYAFVSAINPVAGTVVLVLMIVILTVLFMTPVVLYLRLPQPILAPESDEDKDSYHRKVTQRLSRNKLIRQAQITIENEQDLTTALALLDDKANSIIKRTAGSVFLTTAISQNGKLDAFTVFVTQTKMVWDIAHVYYQRPALKDLIYLYGNVGATTLLASEIEEIDLSNQIEPIITTALRQPGRSIPVIGPAANIIFDSMLEGTANAFLTLRVGVVARRYCGSMGPKTKKTIKKAAFAEASVLLKDIVVKSSGQVISAILQSAKKAGTDTLKTGVDSFNKAAENMKKSWSEWTSKKKAKDKPEQ